MKKVRLNPLLLLGCSCFLAVGCASKKPNEKINLWCGTDVPTSNSAHTEKFDGIVERVNSDCGVDRVCSVIVSGKTVKTGIGWASTSRRTKGIAVKKHVEIYGHKISNSEYSILEDPSFYIKVVGD